MTQRKAQSKKTPGKSATNYDHICVHDSDLSGKALKPVKEEEALDARGFVSQEYQLLWRNDV